jgi:hypothetical protein
LERHVGLLVEHLMTIYDKVDQISHELGVNGILMK